MIKDNSMEGGNDGPWYVKSHRKSGTYVVCLSTEVCHEDLCFERCIEMSCLGLCSYMYTCSCEDKSLLCKHIHKVHSVRVRFDHERKFFEIIDIGSCGNEGQRLPLVLHTSPEVMMVQRIQRKENLTARIDAKLEKLHDYLKNSAVQHLLLPNIDGTLQNLVLQCEAILKNSVTEQVSSMESSTATITSNQKIVTQSVHSYPKQMSRLSLKKPS